MKVMSSPATFSDSVTLVLPWRTLLQSASFKGSSLTTSLLVTARNNRDCHITPPLWAAASKHSRKDVTERGPDGAEDR